MSAVHAGGPHERGHIAGKQLGDRGAVRLAGQASPAQVRGEAAEMPGVLRCLECAARLAGREIRDEKSGSLSPGTS